MSFEAAHTSTFASIMVHLDLGVDAEARVKLAGDLADRFGSRLIGVAAEETAIPVYGDGLTSLDAGLVEIEQRRVTEELEKAEILFRRAAGARNSVEWRSGVNWPGAFVAKQARAADLVVVGRQGSGDASQGRMALDPGDLIMNLGRPMLVAPPQTVQLLARRIVVAWKDTREARRAVSDSLPLLKRADEVFVVAVGRHAKDEGAGDVSAHLCRHEVNSRVLLHHDGTGTVANDILRTTEREGADLIVCGAYGHSRAREWILGGVTRDLLDESPVPCLMAH